ncbi:MAG: BamA/TamA family outer membrane protein [Acidobacteriota bacterium]|nr:BamA/TamA family outer membrane protein [Acidobacteriota bacterium]
MKQKVILKAGFPFLEHDLRQSIQNLFASGRYSDLAVDAEETDSGVSLRFLTKRAYFIGRVLVTGVKEPPNNGQLTSATKLRLGMPFRDADKNDAISSLQNLLLQNGFYRAHIDAIVVRRPETERADVTFTVTSGSRAHFQEPIIAGDPERAKEASVRVTHWKRIYGLLRWQEVSEVRVRQGIENLRRSYDAQGRLQATITLNRLNYRPDTNTVEPSLTVEAGPRTSLLVEGAKVSRGKLRQLVPIFQERAVDPAVLKEGEQNIAEYLQSQGYFGAQVSYSVENQASSGETVITYRANPGERHRFVQLEFHGNRYFSRKTIQERFYIEPAQFPRFPYGRYTAAYLSQDIQSIRNLYLANGFRDVKIISKVVDDYRGVKNHLAVFLTIDEGPQWVISNLTVTGTTPADLMAIRPGLASTQGQPFSPVSVASDRDNVLGYYFSHGYLNATFEFFETPLDEKHTIELRYVVTPGVQKYIRDVLVSGLETTRPSLVFNRIGLRKGALLSLTEETDSQRRLYDLGIFARVNTALQNPDGEENDKYVLYDIDEARHYSLNVGVGAQIARIGGGATSLNDPAGSTGFAPRLAVGISRINFLGLGQTLGLQTAVSTIEQKAALTYFIPQFVARSNLSLTTTGLIENSNDIRTYTAHRREAAIQLGQRLSRAYTVQYRLVFRNVTLTNLKIDPLLVPLLAQPEVLGLGEISFIQDKRDDPADAHHGIYSTADLSYAPTVLGSQTSFTRALFRNSTYHALHRDLVFARSTQFGLISRVGGAMTIPLAERLYSGGSTSLRSFPDFQAGPRDLHTGFPLGGNALFVNNLELRFPLYGDNVGGVLFEDAGNVYSSLGDFSLRFRQRNLQDFNYTVQSLGFGIRYRTPIGPVRLDFSFSPDAPRFFGLKGTLDDLVNGTAKSSVQKINAFQFHFSLGQAF